MLPVKRFHWDTPEYAEAFAALLKCAGERVYVYEILRGILSHYPAESHAIDWGAGQGDITDLISEHFRYVYAVEPHPGMRAALATRCPQAHLFEGTIMSIIPPTKVEVGLISHVFYHIPDHQWGAHTIHAAHQLTQDGVLIVTLKDPGSGCNQMLEHFGAPRYDLYDGLARVMRRHPEFDFSFTHVPGSLSTSSFEETLTIARFMLCDRDAEAFSRPPTEDQFVEYVREHFWDERKGTGGWHCAVVCCFVRRNARYARRSGGG